MSAATTPTYTRIQTTDNDLNRVQSSIVQALSNIGQTDTYSASNVQSTINQLGGVILQSVSLVAGQDNLIAHKLGRMPNFYFNGPPSVSSTVWSPVSSSLAATTGGTPLAFNDTYINLHCSTNCTVLLWVN